MITYKPKISEHDIQRAVCIWLDGTPTRAGALRSGVVYWHTPNGGTRRDAFEGKRLKEIGLRPGVHDLLFLAPASMFGLATMHSNLGLLFGLEMKQPGGVLSPAQREMHPRLLAAGMAASAVVDNLAAAKAQLVAWGLAFS